MAAWIIPLLAYLLAVVSFALGAYDPVWSFLGLPDDLRAEMTTGFSLLLILLGHFLGVLLRDQSLKATASRIETDLKRVTYAVGQSAVHALGSGDDGLRYLVGRYPVVANLRNTRIPSAGATAHHSTFGAEYGKALEKLVARGAVVQEVVGMSLKDSCDSLLGKAAKGSYEYRVLGAQPAAIVNFSILGFADGSREIVFGAPGASYFLSRDPALVDLFEVVFRENFGQLATS
jgi:hypothetical protein